MSEVKAGCAVYCTLRNRFFLVRGLRNDGAVRISAYTPDFAPLRVDPAEEYLYESDTLVYASAWHTDVLCDRGDRVVGEGADKSRRTGTVINWVIGTKAYIYWVIWDVGQPPPPRHVRMRRLTPLEDLAMAAE